MKKLISALVLAMLLAASAKAADNGVGIHLGVYDFNDSIAHTMFTPGYQARLYYERFLTPGLSIGADAGYMRADSRQLDYIRNLTLYTFYLQSFYYAAPQKKIRPFLGAGAGYIYSATENNATGQGYYDDSVAYAAEIGLAYDINDDLSLRLSMRYSLAHALSNVSIRDINLGGMDTGIGLEYRF